MASRKSRGVTGDEPLLPNVNAAPGKTRREARDSLLIVGIGASAGGIDAVSALLRGLPLECSLGVVVIQHLDPVHPSALREVLSHATALPVKVAENHAKVKAGTVYVIPPDRDLVLGDGRLQLSPRAGTKGEFRPIDHFLRSLAEEQGHKAIGVVLSGGGSDGTLGLGEIKAAGGITFAQDKTAEFTSMPRHAIASGSVDFVLPPAQIAAELVRIAGSSWIDRSPDEDEGSDGTVRTVLDSLRSVTGVDFSQYKRSTLNRRIARRMVVHKLENLADYAELLQRSPPEVESLYQDILINVTSFFRNPEAYEALKEKVFPRLTEGKGRHQTVRAWTLGCATGEEAYSVAMAYTEYQEASGTRVPMQLFATDLNGVGIERARSGVYSKGIVQDVSAERLRRFFVEVDGSYRVCKPIRDMCVFARQNVMSDPPFSRLDLIACRNMLIYLEPGLQRRLLPVLHYALQPGGFLWLGQSETIGAYRKLFEPEDARHKIYARKSTPGALGVPGQASPPERLSTRQAADARSQAIADADPQREADRIVLSRFGPPGVLINSAMEVVQFRGDTGPYLAPAPGRPGHHLLKMLREGLALGVRSAIKQAQRDRQLARAEGLRVKIDGRLSEIAVSVTPLKVPGSESLMLVLFEDPANPAPPMPGPMEPLTAPGDTVPSADEENRRLNLELAATRDYLQSVIESQEAVNEELQSANEEVQSANEELQSINEEMETSKEEIQSSNEELATVNDELQNRNLELSQTNNDLVNLLASSQMAIVMLGPDLRIRRYTPAAEKLLNLIPTDVGRPFTDIKPRFDAPQLEQQLLEVIDTISVPEQEIQDLRGHWYLLRLRPYRTLENRIDGAVMMLVDIDRLKRTEQALSESDALFHTLADAAPALIWTANLQGLEFVNKVSRDFFGAPAAELLGAGWLRFVHSADRDRVDQAWRDAVSQRGPIEVLCRMKPSAGPYRRMRVSAQPRLANGALVGFTGGFVEVVEPKD